MNEIMDTDIQSWLSECRKKATRSLYVYGSDLFFTWLQKDKNISIEQFKASSTKEMKTLVLQFQNSEPKSLGAVYKSKHKHRDTKQFSRTRAPKPLSQNAISSVITAIQSFCMYLEKPLLLRGKRVGLQDDIDSHYFANGDLAKMYDVSDPKGKAILACAASLGWEVSDFLALDRKLVEEHIKKADVEERKFIFFQARRSKTNQPRLAVLNPLAVDALKEWLQQNPTESLFDMSRSGIQKFMATTAKKANLVTTGNVRFHRIRAWVYNSLLKAGFSDPEAKYIVGKAIPHSDSTYLRLREMIEEKYPKLYEQYLNLKPQISTTAVLDLTKQIEKLQQDNEMLRARQANMVDKDSLEALIQKTMKHEHELWEKEWMDKYEMESQETENKLNVEVTKQLDIKKADEQVKKLKKQKKNEGVRG